MALFLLDTTTITHLRNNQSRVHTNEILHSDPDSGHVVAIASVNVEEVIGGWISFLQQARTVQQKVYGAERLNDSIQLLARFMLISETSTAIARFESLRKLKLNVGRNDLRLAALALELGAVVVSDNVRDFGRVPGLQWADWTK
ncbi:MAG: PIN domain-containing protein [Fimbriiglobus sp.]